MSVIAKARLETFTVTRIEFFAVIPPRNSLAITSDWLSLLTHFFKVVSRLYF